MSQPITPADLARCVLLHVDGQPALVRIRVDPAKLTPAERAQLAELVRLLRDRLGR